MRTPIDIYRAKNIIDIYIELSKVDNKYSLNVTGLKNKMSLLLKSRALCYEILKDVYNMKIGAKRIIFKDLDTTLKIREGDLVSIMNLQEREKYRNSIKTLAERSRRKYGKIPTQRIKGFKRVNPKTQPPIEKTW